MKSKFIILVFVILIIFFISFILIKNVLDKQPAEPYVKPPIKPATPAVEPPTEQYTEPPIKQAIQPVISRAIWVWPDHISKYEGNFQEVLDFAEEYQIDTVYLRIKEKIFDKDSERLIGVLDQAKERNVKVYYLYAEPFWATKDGYTSLLGNVTKFYKFDKAHPNLISGAHLDIEQEDTEGKDKWFINNGKIAKEFLQNLKNLKKEFPDLHLSLDTSTWFDNRYAAIPITFDGKTMWFSQHLRFYTDFLTLMDYRDYAYGKNGIIQNAANEMNEGPTVIGLEFSSNVHPEDITFYNEDKPYFLDQLSLVEDYFINNTNFKGFAFHHYSTFKNFIEK